MMQIMKYKGHGFKFTDISDDKLDNILRHATSRDFCVLKIGSILCYKNRVDFCVLIKIGLIFVAGHKNRADFCTKEI